MEMITGAHAVIFSKDAEADRAFFRDILDLPNVDVGGGWLIFALPPSELAFHPSDESVAHETYLLCDDIDAFRERMIANDVDCGEPQDMPWGRLVAITLPGGAELGVYEPKHERPASED